jgi:hypothetical protein
MPKVLRVQRIRIRTLVGDFVKLKNYLRLESESDIVLKLEMD